MSRSGPLLDFASGSIPFLILDPDERGPAGTDDNWDAFSNGTLDNRPVYEHVLGAVGSSVAGNGAESGRENLFTPLSTDCPGGLCESKWVIERAASFLRGGNSHRCYLGVVANGLYDFFHNLSENCTHLLTNEYSIEEKKFKLVVWPLRFATSDGLLWDYLGSGSFNIAYKRIPTNPNEEAVVYKIPRSITLGEMSAYQSPSRCVRLWNEINKNFPAKKYASGWVAPYIEERLSSRNENHVNALVKWLVKLYNTEGRILVDAYPRDAEENILNFRIHKFDGVYKIICIDTDFALNINQESSFASIDSWEYWKENRRAYIKILADNVGNKIERATLALLILNDNLPDFYLNPSDPNLDWLITKLCQCYFQNKLGSLGKDLEIRSRFFSENVLSEKDERGKLLYYDCGLRGGTLRKIYRDRKNFGLSKIRFLIQCADDIGMPHAYLRYLFVRDSVIAPLNVEDIAAQFCRLMTEVMPFMAPSEKKSVGQCILVKRRLEEYTKICEEYNAQQIQEHTLFLHFVIGMSSISSLFEVEINKIVENFELGKDGIKRAEELVLQNMTPRSQEEGCQPNSPASNASQFRQEAQQVSNENRFFSAEKESTIEIKPREKEKTCCCW